MKLRKQTAINLNSIAYCNFDMCCDNCRKLIIKEGEFIVPFYFWNNTGNFCKDCAEDKKTETLETLVKQLNELKATIKTAYYETKEEMELHQKVNKRHGETPERNCSISGSYHKLTAYKHVLKLIANIDF